jgi:PST family polysaccharide transporter
MSADLPKENLTKSTLSAFGWQYTSFIAQAVLQLVVLAVLARLLTPDDFGVVGLAMIFVGFAALFSQLGVGPALIQRSELTPVHIRVGFTLSILLSLIFTLLLIASSPLAAVFLKNDRVTEVLNVISLNFLFAGFGVVAESLLKRNLRFKSLMWANVWSYLIGYAFVGILLAWLGYGVWALVWATLGQSLLKSVLLLFYNPHPLIPSLSRREMRELLFFGGGFTLAHFLNYSANQGDYFVVGRLMGSEALGVYTRAYQLMMLPAKYFGQVLTVVLFPVMAKIQDKRQQLTKTYLTGIAMVTLVSAPLGVLMVTAAPEIVEVLLGPKWTDTVLPFQILALGVVARGSYKIDDALARALGVMYQRSVRDAIYAAGVILGAWIGLRWGLAGVAYGVLGAVVINYVLAMQMSIKLLNSSWSQIIKALIPAIYPTIVVAVVSLSVRSLLRAYGLPAWFTLAMTTLMSGLGLIGLYLLRPQILGFYGIETLKRSLPSLPLQIFPKTISQWLLARLKIENIS